MFKSNPLFNTLVQLKGNPRACVWTEPLWGIPFNLYAPYASLYMIALGVTTSQVGLIASLGMFVQVFSALVSGAITDKLGRKRTTFIFDLISWSIPCLIWAVAQNFTYFVIAAIINGLWRITANSWSCLLVEDANPDTLVDIFSWTHIAGLLAAFVAPLAGVFVGRYGLVPTVRVLYLFAFVSMTAKFVILNVFATETKQGEIRQRETANQSILSILGQYGEVMRQILQARQTLISLGIMLVMSICTMVNGTFWAILVTERLQIPQQNIAMFPFVKSVVMLGCFFFVMPKISRLHFRRPMLTGFALFILSQLLLVSSPVGGYVILLVSMVLEACSLVLIQPFMDSLVARSVDARERARIMALLNVVVISLTSPFGWLAGLMAEADQRLPFMMNIGLFVLGAILVIQAARFFKPQEPAASAS
ncbi:MAG: MFS transporter [Firmicutes bacterium]|nr:MFS transporter [Bacillota bacterium]